MICKKCGNEYNDSEHVCPNCGEPNGANVNLRKSENITEEDPLDLEDLEPINLLNASTNIDKKNETFLSYDQQENEHLLTRGLNKKRLGFLIALLLIVIAGTVLAGIKLNWFQKEKGQTKNNQNHYATTSGDVELSQEQKDALLSDVNGHVQTPTLDPSEPKGVLNEDYIVIGGNEYSTSNTKFMLNNMNLTDKDIEPLQYVKGLKGLFLAGNHITTLDAIKDQSDLALLDAGDNELVDIDALSGKDNLYMLDLRHTNVEDLTPLQTLAALKYLHIEDTNVSDLKPILSLESLTSLYMMNSRVTDLKCLSDLPNLEFCDALADDPSAVSMPEKKELEGFQLTEGDKQYFRPITNDYLIGYTKENNLESTILVSFDENKMCVQYIARVDVKIKVTKEMLSKELLNSDERIKDVNYSGTIVYYTIELENVPRTVLLDTFYQDNCKLLVQHDINDPDNMYDNADDK